jgi:hypothetical protein
MRNAAVRLALSIALFAVAACADGSQHGGAPSPSTAALSQSCARSCDTEYDSCAGRFAGIADPSGFGHGAGDPSAPLSPNDVCPSQLKSCQQRCAP